MVYMIQTISYEIDPIKSIGKVAKENLHTMTEELKAFEQERKRRKATESWGIHGLTVQTKTSTDPCLKFYQQSIDEYGTIAVECQY